MAARDTVPGDRRGGAVIPALRPARARLITGVAGVASLAGAAAFAVSAGGRLAPLADAAAPAGVLLLTAGIVLRRPGTIAWAVLLEGGAYLAGRAGHSTVDGWSALIGTLLLLAAELATWSVEHDARIRAERALVTRRVLTLAALISTALIVNVLLLGTSALSASPGLFVASVGVVAAVASVALVVRLVRT